MNDRVVFESSREFRLWKYAVGHSQLLLRSPSGPEHATCVDIFFKGVSRISSETDYKGLRIVRQGSVPNDERSVAFRLEATDGTGVAGSIEALVAFALEGEISYHDESPIWSGSGLHTMPVHKL